MNMFPAKAADRTAARTADFADLHPAYAYQDDKVIFRDGRVGVGFVLECPEMESWQAEEFANLQSALLGALRTLPVGTVVQKTDVYYDRPFQSTGGENRPGYFEGKMNAHFAERLVLFHRAYLFISFAPSDETKPVRPNALSALVNRAGEKLAKNPFAGVVQTLDTAERIATELLQSLRGLGGLDYRRLNQAQLPQVFTQYFNLEFDQQPAGLTREISNVPGAFTVGENRVSIVSLVGQGSEAHPAVRNGYGVTSPMLYPLTAFLSCPHVLTQALLIQDSRAELKSLDNDKKINNSLSFLATQDNHLRAAEIDEFTAEVRSGSKQVVGLHLSVLLWDVDDQARREHVEKTTAAFRSIFGAEAVVESYLTLPLFFGLAPGNAYQVPDRWLTTSADRAACYFHWTTTYRPEPTGEYLCDRFRNLVKVNLFNTDLDNQNALVIGPSGSGKSYTFGNFIVQRYERGARQIIIDIGGTYRNVFQSLTGPDFENTYFEYDPQNPIEFNPFLLPREGESGPWHYSDEKLNFHLALLAGLWKGGKDRALSKSERTILSRFLTGYYHDLNQHERLGQSDEEFPGMESFYKYVQRYDQWMRAETPAPGEGDATDESIAVLALQRAQYQTDMKYIDMHEFFLVLGEFVSGGRYAKVLNSTREAQLSQYPLICFDLARVKTDPTLYPVVAMLITELSLDLFRQFPDAVKYIALDEAWALLSGVLEEFIVSMYRTIRKTNGSITIITQGIQEIIDSPIGYTLIDNSSTKIILRHSNEASLNRLQAPLGLTGHEMDLIRSVRSTDSFREFFIKQGAQAKVYALEASPQLDAVLTSRPAERNYLNQLVRHYQRQRPVEVRDALGNLVRDADGWPTYTTVTEQRLDFAVDQFVEEKRKRKGALSA
ncbi:TraG family conjugative transposon ATPase [Hymenobacter saemangeumensis]|uniref:TraG family conjugative transposon ATPase n=1 Tax=Hymenobacter saemangeumensis TaxID=1084522 RepID=A0ABP8INA2_9BACT